MANEGVQTKKYSSKINHKPMTIMTEHSIIESRQNHTHIHTQTEKTITIRT